MVAELAVLAGIQVISGVMNYSAGKKASKAKKKLAKKQAEFDRKVEVRNFLNGLDDLKDSISSGLATQIHAMAINGLNGRSALEITNDTLATAEMALLRRYDDHRMQLEAIKHGLSVNISTYNAEKLAGKIDLTTTFLKAGETMSRANPEKEEVKK